MTDTLTLSVALSGKHFEQVANIEVTPFLMEGFEPIHSTDNSFGRLVGDVEQGGREMQVVLRQRKDHAKYLANILVNHIMEQMGKYDTLNGYKIVREGDEKG